MIISKIKELIKRGFFFLGERDIFIVIFFIVSVIISFNLGRISEKEERTRITYERSLSPQKTLTEIKKDTPATTKGVSQADFEKNIWGSRSGTKFYYAWCSGASRIKEENRVYYTSKEEAMLSGRTIASGCK